jgi:type IV fimbrial biogenesis protein FimT
VWPKVQTMKKIFGFTLVELMITAAVLAIVLSFAAPSLRELVLDNRLVGQTNQLVASLRLARSEAVKRAREVTMKVNDDSDDGNEWGPGWTIWVDEDEDGNIDSTEEVLRVVAAVDTSIDSTGGRTVFKFQSTGLVDNSDIFDICDDRTGETGRQVSLEATGQAGVTNSDLDCP